MSAVPASTISNALQAQGPWRQRLSLGAAVLIALGATLIGIDKQLPALACMAAGAGTLVLCHPNLAVPITALVMYTNAAAVATRFHGIPKIAAAGVFLLLAIPLYHHVVVLRKKLIVTRALPWIVAFLAIQLVSTLTAQRSELSIDVVFTSLSEGLVIYLLITNTIRDKSTLRRVIGAVLVAGCLLGIASTAQQLTGDFYSNYGGFAQIPIDETDDPMPVFDSAPRAAGPIGEKNYFAQFMLLLLPLGITVALSPYDVRKRIAAILACMFIALAVAFTASRGAAIAAVAMVGAMVFLKQIQKRHVLMLVLAAAVVVMASPQFRTRIMTMVDLANWARGNSEVRQVDVSTQGRISEMIAAVLIFADQPILGAGPGNFPSQFLEKAGAMGFQVHAEERMAHCAILEIAAENGIFGLICVVAIFVVSFRELSRARAQTSDPEMKRLTTAMLICLFVLVLTSLFLSFAYVRYYWFILAIAAATAQLASTPDPHNTVRPGVSV